MNKFEKIENAINLKPLKNISDIPGYPMIITYAAVPAGKTQAEIFKDNSSWMDALVKCYEEIGSIPDVVFPMNPLDTSFIEQLKVRIPGKELEDDELFQFLEEELMCMDDYKKIIKKGMSAWQLPFVASIQNPPFTGMMKNMKVISRFIKIGKNLKANRIFWEKQGGSCNVS